MSDRPAPPLRSLQGERPQRCARVALQPAPQADAGQGRDFEYTSADFERVRALIHGRVGISLSARKIDLVYSRLARRLRALGLKRFRDYLDRLERDPGPEWEAFTNALTTNLTSFFREAHHFPLLAEHLLARRATGRLQLWCCAASTGEEPYSMAMTAVEAFGGFEAPVSILATDVDTEVLRKAEAGEYPVEQAARLSEERLRRFFLPGAGAVARTVKVRPELKRMVSFRPLNLLHATWRLRGPFDAIFCRNVMIYFDKPTQAGILRRFAPLMKDDGLLFMGHSESLFQVADVFRLRGRTIYERRLDGRRDAA